MYFNRLKEKEGEETEKCINNKMDSTINERVRNCIRRKNKF